jgi:(E)-4-hydroxy-3-methylbut-2-enyl-diphosphate synthase
MDMAPIADKVAAELSDVTQHITVAIMGCVVNGPGEAQDADVAICAGAGKAILYLRGKPVRTVQADEIVQAVVQEVRKLT